MVTKTFSLLCLLFFLFGCREITDMTATVHLDAKIDPPTIVHGKNLEPLADSADEPSLPQEERSGDDRPRKDHIRW